MITTLIKINKGYLSFVLTFEFLFKWLIYFRIVNYASVSTQTSVLIIGGAFPLLASIFEYEEDKWTVIGNLKQARSYHQVILYGSLIMIFGGNSYDKPWV